MITSHDIKTVALPLVALRKKMLHDKMLSAPIETLAELRVAIDEYNKLERFLNNEMKDEGSNLFRELNK